MALTCGQGTPAEGEPTPVPAVPHWQTGCRGRCGALRGAREPAGQSPRGGEQLLLQPQRGCDLLLCGATGIWDLRVTAIRAF